MGLFSSIGKFFKKIGSGIKKVFKKIMKPIAKFLDSKIGKVIMLGIAVFTMGTALAAFKGGFSALQGSGFIAKFVNGGKAFLNSLVGTSFEVAGQAVEGAGVAAGALTEGATAEGAVNAGEVLAGADPAAVVGAVNPTVAGGTGTMGVPAAAPAAPGAEALTGVTVPPSAYSGQAAAVRPVTLPSSAVPKVMPTGQEGNWLSRAATAAKEFAGTPGGATLIGGTMAGYGRGAETDAWLQERRRVSDMFEDPNDPGVRGLAEQDYRVDVPRNLAGASARSARREATRGRPTIPFTRPVPVGG